MILPANRFIERLCRLYQNGQERDYEKTTKPLHGDTSGEYYFGSLPTTEEELYGAA